MRRLITLVEAQSNQPTKQSLLVVVHPGSACGSVDFNLGSYAGEEARGYLASDIASWQDGILVIDGQLSDELPEYPELDNAIKSVLARAKAKKLISSRIFGDDDNPPHQDEVALRFIKKAKLKPTEWIIELTGAWGEDEGVIGCVTSVYHVFRDAGFQAKMRNSTICLSDIKLYGTGNDDGGEDVEDVEESVTSAPLQPPTPERLTKVKTFLLQKWKERAKEREYDEPGDLSDACKFVTLFIKEVFGGTIRGNWDHQYNILPNGERLDLTAPSKDLTNIRAAGRDPYHHDRSFWGNPDHKESMQSCLPRVKQWVTEFLSHVSLHEAEAMETPAQELVEAAKAYVTKHGELSAHLIATAPDIVNISVIKVSTDARGQGEGSAFLNWLTEEADFLQVTLTLEPYDFENKYDEYNGLTYDDLVAWYQRNGFAFDPSSIERMIRHPQKLGDDGSVLR